MRTLPDPPRRTLTPRQAAVALLTALLLALLLEAPSMERSAQSSPYGARRSLSLAVLHPIAAVSQRLMLDRPRAALDALTGHGADTSVPAEALPPPLPRAALLRTTPVATPSPAVSVDVAGAERVVRTVPHRRAIDRAAPLRVWVGGDSVAAYLGYATATLGEESGDIAARVHYKISTGLARPDYYDWPAHLEEDMQQQDPEVVVLLMGANDDQPLLLPDGSYADFGTPAWRAEYGRRVGAVMDRLTAEGRLVFWVGLPPMRSGEFQAHMDVVDDVLRAQALTRNDVTYIDSREVMSNGDGAYAAYLPDASGQQALMRAQDGIHLTLAGGTRLAATVVDTIRRTWAEPLDSVATEAGWVHRF